MSHKKGEETGVMEFQFDSEFPRLLPRSQPLLFPENGPISQLVQNQNKPVVWLAGEPCDEAWD